ncbi:hypothetical protein [Marinobacter shengliensis]|uniref:hypothetical protein n=1 Tax=Marinobacter shengliensis TaxID=1389223 RepID=UPI0011087DC3|nr:hypothetical protein [Marinobacter shengliensis]
MDLFFFLLLGLMKAVSTLFLLVLPVYAWRRGLAWRAVALSVIALGFAALVWWPQPDEPSQILAHIKTQMLWFSVVVLAFAPLAMLFHRLEKSRNQ